MLETEDLGSTTKYNHEYYNGDITWLKTGELNNSIVTEFSKKITQLALKECSPLMNKIGNALIVMYGAAIGKLAIVEKKLTANQACCGCEPFHGIYSKYFSIISCRKKDL